MRSCYKVRYSSAELHRCCSETFECIVDVARFHVRLVAVAHDALYLCLFLQPVVVAFARSNAQFVRFLRKTSVGVVLAQQNAVLGARGEHTVRFVNALSGEIVDENADIRLVAFQDERGRAAAVERCVHTSH